MACFAAILHDRIGGLDCRKQYWMLLLWLLGLLKLISIEVEAYFHRWQDWTFYCICVENYSRSRSTLNPVGLISPFLCDTINVFPSDTLNTFVLSRINYLVTSNEMAKEKLTLWRTLLRTFVIDILNFVLHPYSTQPIPFPEILKNNKQFMEISEDKQFNVMIMNVYFIEWWFAILRNYTRNRKIWKSLKIPFCVLFTSNERININFIQSARFLLAERKKVRRREIGRKVWLRGSDSVLLDVSDTSLPIKYVFTQWNSCFHSQSMINYYIITHGGEMFTSIHLTGVRVINKVLSEAAYKVNMGRLSMWSQTLNIPYRLLSRINKRNVNTRDDEWYQEAFRALSSQLHSHAYGIHNRNISIFVG